MSKYSILKLTNGQDIMGKRVAKDLDSDETSIKIDQPMSILSTVMDTGATIVFLRSYAILSKDKTVSVEAAHIITEYEPQKVMIDYYLTMIEYNKKFIENDMVSGMKTAQAVIKNVLEKGNTSHLQKDPYEKSMEYWESLMKSGKKH